MFGQLGRKAANPHKPSKVLFLFFPPLAAFWLKTKAAGVAGTKYGTASY